MKKKRLFIVFVLTVSIILVSSWAAAASVVWIQSNVSGFGDVDNFAVQSLTPFGGQLYAGTANDSGDGAQLWRKGDSRAWSQVIYDGFDNTNNSSIAHLYEFNDQLYAGTGNDVEGGQVLRSSDGSNWNPTTLPGFDPTNGVVIRFTDFKDQIYASTWSFTDTHGAEIWRSSTGNSGNWTQVVANGFNSDVNNVGIVSLEEFNGYLYAGTDNAVTGAEVWYTDNGASWNPVNTDGFGDPYNWSATLEEFNGYLYAGTYNYKDSNNPGAELWRCLLCDGSDWQQVPITKGFGDTENRAIRSLLVFDGELYAATYNGTTGIEVWRSMDGMNWIQVNNDGFGDSNNRFPYWDNSVTVFNNGLYVGTWNRNDGGGGVVVPAK